jgi:hypothetical protein
LAVTFGTLFLVLKDISYDARQMKKQTSKKPPKSVPVSRPSTVKREAKVVPLPPPVPAAKKEPGLITSFINMVDIAEAISQADNKKK